MSTAVCKSAYQPSTRESIVLVGVLGVSGGGSGVLSSVALNPCQSALL